MWLISDELIYIHLKRKQKSVITVHFASKVGMQPVMPPLEIATRSIKQVSDADVTSLKPVHSRWTYHFPCKVEDVPLVAIDTNPFPSATELPPY